MTAARIHVAHVLFRFATGGLENGLVNLINRLEPADYRHSVISLTAHDPNFRERLEADNVELFDLHKAEGNDPRTLWRMFRLLRRLRPTHLHTRNFVALEVQAVGVAAGVRARIHGEHGWDVQDLDGSNRKYQLARRVMSPAVHRFVALSRHLRSYLVELVGVPAAKVRHICNGVDVARFHPRDGDGTAPVVLGTVGRMKTVKNQTGLCRSFARMLDARPALRGQVRLRLLGEGPLLEECRDIVAAAGCADHVEFAGASDAVAAEMRAMDVFVLPSKAEGISNTILEAMATGLPVVATRVGGNGELVSDGSTGTLVAADDEAAMAEAMARYVEDSGLRHCHGLAGRRRAEAEFSLAGMVDAYDGLYREFL
ncbi:MAG: TIGR03088 family PEP-CTERM/XrtA system glycosyltransferase [Gammaproteobacteria bacterium]